MTTSEWEVLGGSYWIIQEEILRHLIHQIFEEALLDSFPSKKNFKTKVEIELFKLLPCPLPPYITNTTLIKKIQGLKENAAILVKEMNATDEPKVYYYYITIIYQNTLHIHTYILYIYSSKYTNILLHIIMYTYLSIEIPISAARDVPTRVLHRVVHRLG